MTRYGRPCVGYGVPFDDDHLIVPCGRCLAAVGVPCTKRGGGTHTIRQDRSMRLIHKQSAKLFSKLEREALQRDPNSPLWTFDGRGHRCGVLGPHPLSDCVLPVNAEATLEEE